MLRGRAAEHPVDGRGHIACQRVVGTGRRRDGVRASARRRPGLARRVPRPAAVGAHGSSQPAHQRGRAAGVAAVQFFVPRGRALAVGAHQHLLVASDTPAPSAPVARRIGLAGSAAVAGHRVLRPQPVAERWEDHSAVGTRAPVTPVLTAATVRSSARPAWSPTSPEPPTASLWWTGQRWERRPPRRPGPRVPPGRLWA